MNAHIRLSDLLERAAARGPQRIAFVDGVRRVDYEHLRNDVVRVAMALQTAGITQGQRVATYAPKRYETIVTMLAVNLAGAIIVPINPQLKAHQVYRILDDSGTRLLLSTPQRLHRLGAAATMMAESGEGDENSGDLILWSADELTALGSTRRDDDDAATAGNRPIDLPVTDADPAAILYTSGSTGHPKGVVLSQRNLVAGAESVAAYQRLTHDDVILGILPLSFDAGLSQLTTALAVGACYAPLDFLTPDEVPVYCERVGVSSITAVPPLWMQLAAVGWPAETAARLRRIANTGGTMPTPLFERLRHVFPNALPYLMYGLTEAFRSTYLAPEDAATRPDSIGKAVPNAQILILRPDGSECADDEPGELVHRGAFVTLGYWRAPDLTAARFRPLPRALSAIALPDTAVWSGDIVRRDKDGYLYFVARADDMIKTSGYRVSPTEIEEVVFGCAEVLEAAAFGVPHPTLGQAIVVCVRGAAERAECVREIARACRERLPSYMVPLHIDVSTEPLPRNANGKIDRSLLKVLHAARFDIEAQHAAIAEQSAC